MTRLVCGVCTRCFVFPD